MSSVGHTQSTSDDLARRHSQQQDKAKTAESGPAPTAAPAPPTASANPAPAAPRTPPAAKAPAKREPNRRPAFISLGVGGVLAGASLATGLIAKAKFDDAEGSCGPHCTDSQLSGSRTFAITSTVLTGAAVVGVGLGVALLLMTQGDDAELGKNAPRFDVALGPTAAAANAAWSF